MSTSNEIIEVQNIDHFIYLLGQWHKQHVDVLEHMLHIPEGNEVTFNDKTEILSGDLHRGFLMGLSLGLMELGNLPFVHDSIEREESNESVH